MIRRVGNAFAAYLGGKEKRVVVGRDARIQSASLKEALIQGLLDAGAYVLDVGICTTPMHYFAIGRLRADGGLMVTASHNPPEYNGVKVSVRDAVPCSYEKGLSDIERIYNSGKYIRKKGGYYESIDIFEEYRKKIRDSVFGISPLKVCVDTANGVVGLFVKQIFEGTPINILGLYFEPDGHFPNHEPNPLKEETLRDLQEMVVRTKSDFGVAFDGDGDRCRFVTEKGEPVGADIITALVARRKIEDYKREKKREKKKEGAKEETIKIVYDLRSSKVVPEEIESAGGVPVCSRVGHAYMKEVMRANDALFGGELSGHFYFRENYYADSGMLIFASVASIVSERGEPLSKILRPILRYSATGEKNYEVTDKDAVIKRITEHYCGLGAKINTLDGVTISFDKWWFNLRKSNTEPYLRLNLEADTPKMRDRKLAEVERLIKDRET
jgi:phosphomannomutase